MERSGPDDARDDSWDAWDAWNAQDDSNASRASGSDPELGPSDDHHPFDARGNDAVSRFGGRGFEMFDDLDDLADDPDSYPPAPLPPHERVWRHPSEMGEAAWIRSEPPLAIGRGLLVTSGAIGSALGVAVLYLMMPTAAGTPSAGPAATSSFAADRAPVITLAEPASAAETGGTSSLMAESSSTIDWPDGTGLTLPAPDTPSTMLVMPASEHGTAPLSVAISIEGSPYVVTTANALASLDLEGDGVQLLGPGTPDEVPPLGAELLSIEGDLAYLSPASEIGRIELVSFAQVDTAEPGQPVTVLADEPAVVPYVSGESVPELDPDVIVEGTPVVDADGALVALCTVVIDADGAYVDMVPLTPPVTEAEGAEAPTETSQPEAPVPATSIDPALPEATAPTTAPTTVPSSGAAVPGGASTPASPGPPVAAPANAWIGLRFDGAPTSAPLTVTGVVAGSPALAAGVVVGERLVAIDGVTVSTVDDVIAAVRRRQPGDAIRLSLAPASSTAQPTTTTTAAGTGGAPAVIVPTANRTVSVVLGALAPTV